MATIAIIATELRAARLRNETWEKADRRMKRAESIKEKEEEIKKVALVTTIVTGIGTTAVTVKNHAAIEAEMQRTVNVLTSLTDVDTQEVQLPEVQVAEAEATAAAKAVAEEAAKAAAEVTEATKAKVEVAEATEAKVEVAEATEAKVEVAEATEAEVEVAEATEAEVEVAEATEAKTEAEVEVAEATEVKVEVAEAPVAEVQVAEASAAEAIETEVEVAEATEAEVKVAEATEAKVEVVEATEAKVEVAEEVVAQPMQANHQMASVTHNGVTIRFFPVDEEFLWQNAVKTGNYAYTEADLRLMEKVICAEAKNQGLAGQILVGNVVLNRVQQWGGSIYEIITSQGQFASISGVKDSDITDEIRQAAKMAFEMDLTEGVMKAIAEENGFDASYYQGGATYFFNPEGCSSKQLLLREHIVGVRYKGHSIYRK